MDAHTIRHMQGFMSSRRTCISYEPSDPSQHHKFQSDGLLLSCSVSDGADPLSEAEMDVHTIRHMRDAAAAEGHPPKALVHLSPEDTLAVALRRLLDSQTSMAPVLSPDPQGTSQ